MTDISAVEWLCKPNCNWWTNVGLTINIFTINPDVSTLLDMGLAVCEIPGL
jgi:hypothetical protein